MDFCACGANYGPPAFFPSCPCLFWQAISDLGTLEQPLPLYHNDAPIKK